jgi:DNA-binding NtrC family response regulator
MKPYKILLVDDRVSSLKAIKAFLEKEDYEVITANSGQMAEDLFREHHDVDIVLTDLKMPGMDGLALYRRLKRLNENVILIIMTAHGTIESSVAAMREGVYDYVTKPLIMEELLVTLGKAIHDRQRDSELVALRNEVAQRYGYHNIVGQSRPMQEAFGIIKAVAPTEATVLLTGETGTGKELFTKAIHYNSSRREAPMVCIDCGALSESLLEAELFGYIKGAFTGADTNRTGRLEAAHRGTLFLDEVGQMSMGLQAKLLRFLQERTFEPVGSITPRSVDVRVIAATNRDLRKEAERQRFLPDLFYRLQVIQITIPPLRDRISDIPLLIEYFLKKAAAEHKKPLLHISDEALDALMAYPWPGNVRELYNTVSRLVILSQTDTVGLEDVPSQISESYQAGESTPRFFRKLPNKGITIREAEIELIKMSLEYFGDNRSLTAKALGISRKSLYERIQRYGLDSSSQKG